WCALEGGQELVCQSQEIPGQPMLDGAAVMADAREDLRLGARAEAPEPAELPAVAGPLQLVDVSDPQAGPQGGDPAGPQVGHLEKLEDASGVAVGEPP